MEPRELTYAEVNATRRSVTSWTGEVVGRALLTTIVEEATRAPSAFNGQPWRVVVVQGDALAALRDHLGGNADKVEAAGTLAVLLADTECLDGREGFYDGTLARTEQEWAARNVGLLGMNLMLAAWSHGVGTRPMIGFDAAGLREGLGLSTSWHPVLMLAVGWPDGEPTHPQERVPVEQVLTFR